MRLLADHNFDERILRPLARLHPAVQVVLAREVGQDRTPDEDLLAWCAAGQYVLLTHDVSTVPPHANTRIAAGLPMPGVILVPADLSIGRALDDLLLLFGAGDAADLENRVTYLPL